MKKITLLLLISVYTLSILGIGVRQFYCCGKLKSTDVSFIQEAKEKCGNSNGMAGCCRTNFKNFKVKDSHVAADAISIPVKHFTDLRLFTPSSNSISLAVMPMSNANTSHGPPLRYGIPIYILHCVYRI